MTSSAVSPAPTARWFPGPLLGAFGFLDGVWGTVWIGQMIAHSTAVSTGRTWEPNMGLFLLAAIVMLPCHLLTLWLTGKRPTTGMGWFVRSLATGMLTVGVCLLLGPQLLQDVPRDDGPLLYLMMLAVPTVGVTWGVGTSVRSAQR